MLDFFRKLFGQKILNIYHLKMAILANLFYGFPSRKLRVIGVTGTDGKTTTVNMIASILRAANLPTAHLSTVNAQIGGKVYDTGLHTTTPSSFLLQKLISKAVKAGSKYLVLEVTSHALDQYRTWGIDFETAVITNVSHEHLDYHKDLDNYMAAKARLFRNVEYGILNMDDGSFEHMKGGMGGKGELITYGFSSKANVWAGDVQESLTQTKFIARTALKEIPIELNLPGKFNVYNALAAIVVAQVYNVNPSAMQRGLADMKNIPGRMEFITPPPIPPHQGEGDTLVMVDFAHTPNAIENLLSFLRPKVSGKIIHVFGAAGERDQTKRPFMGQASDKFADVTVLTREDNRSEKVAEICAQIAKGIKHKQKDKEYFIIPDRREAIQFAIHQARGNNDLVVITGKGHEQSLNIDGAETPWDDRKVTIDLLNQSSSPT